MKTSHGKTPKYYWLAIVAASWGTAWSLSWILPIIPRLEEPLLLIALSGFLGGIIAGYGQSASVPTNTVWVIVAPLVWTIAWPILNFGTAWSLLIMTPGIQGFDIDYLTDLAFGGCLSVIPAIVAGTIVALPQSILLQQVDTTRTRRARYMRTAVTMGKIAVSWVIAAFVATATGLVTQYTYPFRSYTTVLDAMLWSIPGGITGGLVFAWLSHGTVEWVLDVPSPKHKSN